MTRPAIVLKETLQRIRGLLRRPPVPSSEPAPSFARALVLGGGGARASYQAGVLQYIADVFPEAHFPILTGVSAGAINTAHLANHTGSFRQAADDLAKHWYSIATDQVFEPESAMALTRRILGKSVNRRHPSKTVLGVEEGQALLYTAPLRVFLEGILKPVEGELVGVAENIRQDRLKAACITATNYSTGQSVTWVQGCDIKNWQRPNRVGIHTPLTVDHVMASTALPLLFPAVHVDNAWYGDGGIRLTAPLSPAVHLGATSIFVISTRYGRSRREADEPVVVGYPPAAQVMGLLMNAIFLDMLDQDAHHMRLINDMVRHLPPQKRRGLRPIKLFMLRPSVDLGRLAGEYELKLGGALRLLTRGLGTEETQSPDWLSMLLFQEEYIDRVVQIGWQDARSQHHQIAQFLDDSVLTMVNGGEG
ncbi:MAG: patatin-like phospholipase family protein [Bacteroidetes bacterium]|nr:patatin-like phospholipase family protein [Bacteroidota bacterium]